jgi:DNA invertase Pin-like site-specific DNA recombinase
MNVQFGYCRISTRKQNIERQVRNIQAVYPNAIIVKETYTGTKFQGRKELDKILAKVVAGDTIIFDSVSRMSRNADDGIDLYLKLYDKGINLIFLKEPHINTDTYKSALSNKVQLTGSDVDDILMGVNSYLKKLATKQILLAFEQSEKEVEDLHQRTKEGIETARLNGKQIGNEKGTTLITKKSITAKKIIQEHSIDLGGTLKDVDVIKLAGISRNSYYKYKRELLQ